MKVVILGGAGMLGHKLWQAFGRTFDAYISVRTSFDSYQELGLFDRARTLEHVRAEDFESVAAALARVRPDVVVNCIGIVKQHAAARDAEASITVNSLFPHRLARLCRTAGSRLIHISTDCVFSGRKGAYTEEDIPDPVDLYGRSKLLGEVDEAGCLTIRTSMIGRELGTAHGLVEWFLGQRGKMVKGYKKAIFSGFTTETLAETIVRIVANHPRLEGLWHVAAEPINKFDLLSLVRSVYDVPVEIVPDDSVVCDRSLDGQRFRAATGIVAPPWQQMIERMQQDKEVNVVSSGAIL